MRVALDTNVIGRPEIVTPAEYVERYLAGA